MAARLVEVSCSRCSVPVEIVEPISRYKRVRVGSIVTLKCKADVRTTVRWYRNSTQLVENGARNGIYVITSIDRWRDFFFESLIRFVIVRFYGSVASWLEHQTGKWEVAGSSLTFLSSLVIRRTRLSTIGDRAFPVAASSLWNTLPQNVTSVP